MTPEEELTLLIEEQRKDDTYEQRPERFVSMSLDKPIGDARDGATVGSMFGVDEEGQVFCFLPRTRGYAMGRLIPHGTPGGYTNHGCHCRACTSAQSARHRDWYARNRKRSVETKACEFEGCDNTFETTQPHSKFCSKRCRERSWYARIGSETRRRRRQVLAAA